MAEGDYMNNSGLSLVEGAVMIGQIKNKDDIPTMRDLNRYVIRKYAADWYDIGIELGLELHVLDVIEKDNPQQSVNSLRKVLDKWLRLSPDATWRTLEIALTNVRRLNIGLDPVDDVYVPLMDTTDCAQQSDAKSRHVIQDKGLDISGCTIDTAFTKVSFELLNLLDGKISVEKIRVVCFANANTHLGIGYPEGLKHKMIGATSVAGLFEVLTLHPTHWSWMNIQVMEKIASVTEQATKLVQHYKNVISCKKVNEILQKNPKFQIDETFYCKIKEKWDKALDEITFKDIEDHQSHIGEVFGISKSAIVLVDIVKGCVENHWMVSRTILHHVQNKVQKNATNLSHFNIISLTFVSDNDTTVPTQGPAIPSGTDSGCINLSTSTCCSDREPDGRAFEDDDQLSLDVMAGSQHSTDMQYKNTALRDSPPGQQQHPDLQSPQPVTDAVHSVPMDYQEVCDNSSGDMGTEIIPRKVLLHHGDSSYSTATPPTPNKLKVKELDTPPSQPLSSDILAPELCVMPLFHRTSEIVQ